MMIIFKTTTTLILLHLWITGHFFYQSYTTRQDPTKMNFWKLLQ